MLKGATSVVARREAAPTPQAPARRHSCRRLAGATALPVCCPARRSAVRSAATASPSTPSSPASPADRESKYQAEFEMMSKRLGGAVQLAVTAAVTGSRDTSAAAKTKDKKAKKGASQPASPAGLASAFLRCLEAQLEGKKYMSGGDEAGDVLGSFPSASLLYYPGSGLQGVVEEVAAAAGEARGATGPAVVGLLRSLAAAVGRVASAANAEVTLEKASAVMTCLYGMADALEGTTKSANHHEAVASAGIRQQEDETTEAAELLHEATALIDCIADGSPLSTHTTPEGRTVSPSSPAHPLLSALETRLYGDATWRPHSAAEIASSLVDSLATLLSPARAATLAAAATSSPSGAAARGSVCGALHGMARAQAGLATTLAAHGAHPGSASRLLAGLAEALATACITRDAADPGRGPRPETMFGEAQLLMGLSRMAAGEALSLSQTPVGTASAAAATAAAVAADAAAGDTSSDPRVAVSDSSLVLEVLAAQAQQLAASHRNHITQVLQDLRDVPSSLPSLSELPSHIPAGRAGAVSGAEELIRRTIGGPGTAAAADAAASVASEVLGAAGGAKTATSPSALGEEGPLAKGGRGAGVGAPQ